jgi:hypothetical protein
MFAMGHACIPDLLFGLLEIGQITRIAVDLDGGVDDFFVYGQSLTQMRWS